MLRLAAYMATAYLTIGAFFFFSAVEAAIPGAEDLSGIHTRRCGFVYQDLRILVGSAGQIHTWWIPHPDAATKTIVMFHGNGYILKYMATIEAPALHALRVNLLLVDYRGSGSSTDLKPDESTIEQDADAALQYVLDERKIPADTTFVMGRSIGSGPAVYLASRNPSLAGLILESPFSSVDDVAHNLWYLRMYPAGLMLRTHFDNYMRIASVRVPLFIATGTADDLTPPWMAQKLFARAGEPKKLLLIDHAGHNDLVDVGGARLRTALQNFIDAKS
jgi:pimeloyl-ACP methyl ester carboxylesterase